MYMNWKPQESSSWSSRTRWTLLALSQANYETVTAISVESALAETKTQHFDFWFWIPGCRVHSTVVRVNVVVPGRFGYFSNAQRNGIKLSRHDSSRNA